MPHLHFDYPAGADRDGLLTREHREMIAAIETRDLDEADRLAHAHTRQFHDRFLPYFSRNTAAGFPLDPSKADLVSPGENNA